MPALLSDPCQFSWKGSSNPDDLSGVASFKVGHESVDFAMDNINYALKLHRLIDKACDWHKQRVIDQAITGLSKVLNEYRYD